MARSRAEAELDDEIECPICTEVFTDPRVLPCIHTFCLKCLLQLGRDRRPADIMSCPVCRKAFTVSAGGLTGLPRNYLMQKFLDVKKEKKEVQVQFERCQRHESDIKLMCVSCKVAVCSLCFIERHEQHRYCKLNKYNQLIGAVEKVTEVRKKAECLIPHIDDVINKSIKRGDELRDAVTAETDRWLSSIQERREALQVRAQSVQLALVEEAYAVNVSIRNRIAALRSYEAESNRLLRNGSADDIANKAMNLHEKALELTKVDIESYVDKSLPKLEAVVFHPSELKKEHLIGDIAHALHVGKPSVKHVTTKGSQVGGVASLEDDFYVIRRDSRGVEIFDAATFIFRYNRAVPGLGPMPIGLTVCALNRCLYISDHHPWTGGILFRVQLGSESVKSWRVANRPGGVSVNNAHNVLVVSQVERKLQEFTTSGTRSRLVELRCAR